MYRMYPQNIILRPFRSIVQRRLKETRRDTAGRHALR